MIAIFLAVVGAMTPVVPPAFAAEGVTGLSIMADGFARTWRAPAVTFDAPIHDLGTGPVHRVKLYSNTGYPYGLIEVAAPEGETLHLGSYVTQPDGSVPGPTVWFNETGCARLSGTFDVLELGLSGDTITSMALRFTVQCVGETRTRTGEYRYNSTVDLQGPDLAPHDQTYVGFGHVVGGTVSEPVTVTLSNRGTAAFMVSDVSITGSGSGSFRVVGDTCSAQTLGPGDTCTADVVASPPPEGGWAEASLTFASNAARPTFGQQLSVTGLTATTLEITTPATIVAGQGMAFTAHLTPVAENTIGGSVAFYLDSDSLGSGSVDANGDAWVAGYATPGRHELRAVYSVGECCGRTPAAPSEATKAVTGLIWVNIELSGGAPSPVPEGTQVSFLARMTAGDTPASGNLLIRNATTGGVLASVAVTGNAAEVETPVLTPPVGETRITAEFQGDPRFVQASTSVVLTVAPDSSVDTIGLSVSPTTFYPVTDGYRDRVTIKGTTQERANVKVLVSTASGKLVRTLSLGSVNGDYSTTWNGRTSGGSLLPAGSYVVRQMLTDAKGNVLRKDTTVKLSWRKVKWVSTSITQYGASYWKSYRGGSGTITKSGSSYSHGVKLSGGAKDGGYAGARWWYTLKPALAYKDLRINVLGKGTRSSSRAILAFGQDVIGVLVGPGYRWWSRAGGVSGHVNSRVALLDVETDGPMAGAFDVKKTRVTYSYAIWP